MPTFFINTDDARISNAFVATLGAAPGATYLAQVKAFGLTNSVNAMINATGKTTAADLATVITGNLGLTGAAATAGQGYLTSVTFAGASSTWAANLMSTLDLFTTLQNDATYGTAASAYVARINSAVAYSATAANNSTDLNVLASAIGSAGSTGTAVAFTLTTNLDRPTLSAGDDVVGGSNTTLQSFDIIAGGNGNDTLSVALGASYSGGATITSIENLVVSATADAVDFSASGIAGITSVRANGNANNDLTISGLGAAASLGVANSSGTAAAGAGSTTFTFVDAALTGTADSVSLSLDNTTDSDGATNGVGYVVNINSVTADASGVETLAVTSSGLASQVQLASNDTSVARLNVAASVATTVNVGTNLTTTARTIDASGSSAAVTIQGLGNAVHTVTGGSGNDVVNFGGNLARTDVVALGAGTDTLASTHANLIAIAADAQFATAPTGVETLWVTNDFEDTAGTILADLFGGSVSNIRIADQGTTTAGALAVTGLVASTATGGNNIRIDGDLGANSGTLTVGIFGATQAGSANEATIELRGAVATATSTIVINGVETLTIDSTNGTAGSTFNITDASLTRLTVRGAQGVDIDGAALGGAVSVVDGSGLTGTAALAVQLSASAAVGATVTSAGGADSITGSSLADSISSGTGNDTVVGLGGADLINVGSGTDFATYAGSTTAGTTATGTFTRGAGTVNSVSTADFDVITGIGAGDTIRISGYTTTGSTATNAGLDTDVVSGNTVATTGGITLAENSVHFIRGTYNSTAQTFAGSSTGTDTLFVFDASHTSNDTDFAAIVLVGYTATTATITGTSGDILLV
jgi:hypothetical protein